MPFPLPAPCTASKSTSRTRPRNCARPAASSNKACSEARPASWIDLSRVWSVGFGQAQHFFCDEAHDQLRTDGRDARYEAFAQIAFDMVFLGIAHAPQRQHGGLTGIESRFR